MAWIDYKKAYGMIPKSWIVNCLKMSKISHEIINFFEKNMKTRRVELTAGGKSLAETKIQRGIFQGDALSPSQFIITMMPLNYILRKCTAKYKLSRSQEKINHLMYMDDIKLFAKKEKELETLIHTVRIYSQDIGMEFGREKCVMLVMKSGKRHMTDRMELRNKDILEADTIKQVEMKFKLDDTNKWFMHKPPPVLENNIHKLLWNFDIKTDHLISTRRPDLIIINQKKKKKKRKFAKLSTLLSRLTTE